MPKASARRRWFAVWRRTAQRPQDDAADWGTAFGLDLSLQPEVEAATARPSAVRKGWVARLGRRRPKAA